MKFELAMLWSDWLIYGLFFAVIILMIIMRHNRQFYEAWRQVLQSRLGMITVVILTVYTVVGLLDSIHLNVTDKKDHVNFASVLDLAFGSRADDQERTYSAPFALYSYSQTFSYSSNGKLVMSYPRLKYAGQNLKNNAQRGRDILLRSVRGFVIAVVTFAIGYFLMMILLARARWYNIKQRMQVFFSGKTRLAWRTGLATFLIIWMLFWIIAFLMPEYHIFGTDKVGTDVFYQTVKSIRTGLIIGTLTTILTLPFALLLGTAAGYFRGWVDDVIQYSYTTLSSIPGVLLIAAMVLVLDVYITRHANWFPTLEQRADARLLMLCFVLGLTSWATLCRLLRGETLKIRQMEYVQAAQAFGVHHFQIILRHILPNVLHIVIITIVIDFSGLVLAEAVLSYVGVGVDPTTYSWGNMINSSRLELAREPIVWWPLVAALILMFFLVLAANLFADKVRDAFDPRLHNLD